VIPAELSLIGPASAPLARLKNRYRWHVALRGPAESEFANLIRPALESLGSHARGIAVDVDPTSMA